MPKKYKTVSEKVADLILNPARDENSEDSEDEAIPPVVDFEDAYELPAGGSTEFRKKNVKLLSEKSARYRGKIASRKDEASEESQQEATDSEGSSGNEEEEADSDDSIGSQEEDAETDIRNGNQQEERDSDDSIGNAEEESDESNESQEERSSESEALTEDDDSRDEDAPEVSPGKKSKSIDIITSSNVQNEVQKGRCVQNQLRIWENLLEVRISMQKVLSKANQLPSPADLNDQRTQSPALQEALAGCEQKSAGLLKTLLSLQHKLHEQFSEIKNSLKRTNATDLDKICEVAHKKQLTQQLQGDFKEFRAYSNGVLLKWDDRTKLLTPGAGSKGKSLGSDYTVIQKIDNALLNLEPLIQKTRICKAGVSNIGETGEQEPNVNVYDDTDFYHQQLRELIEYKTDSSTNMNHVAKQFIELQKLRQKMKKTTDTRASKGRKLRYTVHNKLINFMAPDDNPLWTEESKNELYKSLFAV